MTPCCGKWCNASVNVVVLVQQCRLQSIAADADVAVTMHTAVNKYHETN